MCTELQNNINYFMTQFHSEKNFEALKEVTKCENYFPKQNSPDSKNSRNSYNADCWSLLKKTHGIYMFINSSESKVLYIGEAHKQTLKTRISQHFHSRDKGGLTYKLNNSSDELVHTLYKSLEKSVLYVIKANPETLSKEILYFESFLIGALRPPINFCNPKNSVDH